MWCLLCSKLSRRSRNQDRCFSASQKSLLYFTVSRVQNISSICRVVVPHKAPIGYWQKKDLTERGSNSIKRTSIYPSGRSSGLVQPWRFILYWVIMLERSDDFTIFPSRPGPIRIFSGLDRWRAEIRTGTEEHNPPPSLHWTDVFPIDFRFANVSTDKIRARCF